MKSIQLKGGGVGLHRFAEVSITTHATRGEGDVEEELRVTHQDLLKDICCMDREVRGLHTVRGGAFICIHHMKLRCKGLRSRPSEILATFDTPTFEKEKRDLEKEGATVTHIPAYTEHYLDIPLGAGTFAFKISYYEARWLDEPGSPISMMLPLALTGTELQSTAGFAQYVYAHLELAMDKPNIPRFNYDALSKWSVRQLGIELERLGVPRADRIEKGDMIRAIIAENKKVLQEEERKHQQKHKQVKAKQNRARGLETQRKLRREKEMRAEVERDLRSRLTPKNKKKLRAHSSKGEAKKASGPEQEPEQPTACVICNDAVPRHANVPCGHVCYCDECKEGGDKLRQCPICRAQVERVQKLFRI